VASNGSGRSPHAVSGAILAGGRARRLGGADKAALLVDGRSILERQLDVLGAVASDVFIVANEPARYSGAGVRVVVDKVPGTGPLGGIYTALVTASTPQVLVLACDMPFVSVPLVRLLAERGRSADAAVPHAADGWHPLCASYATRIASRIRTALDEGRLKVIDALASLDLVRVGPEELAAVDPDGTALANVNTHEDYRRISP
jgi:molybdopterin-guanine dinucleotide biosynthesis protein A